MIGGTEHMKQPPRSWYPYRNRIIGGLIAFIFGLLWMWLGFGPALFILVFSVIGYIAGAYFDGQIDLESWFSFLNF